MEFPLLNPRFDAHFSNSSKQQKHENHPIDALSSQLRGCSTLKRKGIAAQTIQEPMPACVP